MRTLLSVPGIDPADTAIALLAEIADTSSYFKFPEKLVKWAGLAPKVEKKLSRRIRSFESAVYCYLKVQEAITRTINNNQLAWSLIRARILKNHFASCLLPSNRFSRHGSSKQYRLGEAVTTM